MSWVFEECVFRLSAFRFPIPFSLFCHRHTALFNWREAERGYEGLLPVNSFLIPFSLLSPSFSFLFKLSKTDLCWGFGRRIGKTDAGLHTHAGQVGSEQMARYICVTNSRNLTNGRSNCNHSGLEITQCTKTHRHDHVTHRGRAAPVSEPPRPATLGGSSRARRTSSNLRVIAASALSPTRSYRISAPMLLLSLRRTNVKPAEPTHQPASHRR